MRSPACATLHPELLSCLPSGKYADASPRLLLCFPFGKFVGALQVWTAFVRPGSVFEIEGGIDESDVGERLGKIPDQPLALDVILFREQAQVVAQQENAFKQRSRIVDAANGFQAAHH